MVRTSNVLYDVLNQLSPASRLFISQNYGNQLKEITDIKEDKNTMENSIVESEVVESEVVESEVVESEVVESEVVESEVVAGQCPYDYVFSTEKLESVLFGDAAKIDLTVEKEESMENQNIETDVVTESSTKTDIPLKDLIAKPVKPKRFINRQKTNDGTNRSASQYIRDIDETQPGLSVSEVIEMGVLVGLTIEPALVYNVRQNVKKKNGTWVANDPGAALLTKQRRQAAAKKAREVRAAKRASKVAPTIEENIAVGQ